MKRGLIKQRRERGEEDVNLRFDWYVDKVPGRSGIAIHGGRNGDDTLGCLLPGDTLEYKEQVQDYTIKNSKSKKMNFLISSNNTGNKELR